MNNLGIVYLIIGVISSLILVFSILLFRYIDWLNKRSQFYYDLYMRIAQDIEDANTVKDSVGFLNNRFKQRTKEIDKMEEESSK